MNVVGGVIDRGEKSSGKAGRNERCNPNKACHDDDHDLEFGKTHLEEIVVAALVNEQQNNDENVGCQQNNDEGHTGKVEKRQKDGVPEDIERHA